MDKHNPIPSILLVDDSAYNIGYAHGTILRGPIHAVIAAWKNLLANETGMEPQLAIERFIQRTEYLSAIQRWTPDLLEELHGLADGAQMDFNTIFTFQLIDEWGNNTSVVQKDHCSVIGFQPVAEQPVCIGYNIDPETYLDNYQMILHIRKSNMQMLLVTCPGMIGFGGMNSHGITVCSNTLFNLNHSEQGLPVACVVRGILEQASTTEAIQFVQYIKHASGQNYLIGGREVVVDFECSANQVVEFLPESQLDIIWHTNHALINDDYTFGYVAGLRKGKVSPGQKNSIGRYKAIRKHITRLDKSAPIDWLKQTLASKDSRESPICGSRQSTGFYAQAKLFTFASMIAVLGEKPELHVSFGPPDEEEYWRYIFG